MVDLKKTPYLGSRQWYSVVKTTKTYSVRLPKLNRLHDSTFKVK